MGFKKESLKLILGVALLGIVLLMLMMGKFGHNSDASAIAQESLLSPVPQNAAPEVVIPKDSSSDTSKEDDIVIQQQLDRDRQEQKQTKNLKIKLEQTNLELEQEKALSEINKLKKENVGEFNEPSADGQSNLPEIKVDYIGGDNLKKEAILSIGNTNYQVKERSNPIANIQVVSISDSSVTLHFGPPQDLTKTIDYKPE